MDDSEGPEHGHRFTFTVTSQGAYGIVDGHETKDYKDSDWCSPPWTITVRAWSLRAALRKAADLPLTAWDGIE